MNVSGRYFSKLLFLNFSLLLVLAACGGGGGGGNGGGGGGGAATLSLSTNNLSFVTNDPSASPATQQIRATISRAVTGNVFIRIVVSGEIALDVSNVTFTSETSGTADISVPPSVTESLGPGQYTGSIQVSVCTSGPACSSGLIGSPQTANVTYTINGVTAVNSELNFTIRDDSVAADYSQQLEIKAYPAFSATVDQAWLGVSPDSGSGGDATVTVDLDQPTLDASQNGSRTANLMVSVSGANSIDIPVNATVEKPQFDFISPYVGFTNVGNTAVVRGQFVDELGSTQIDFATDLVSAGTPATSVSIVSPTEIRVTYPALAAGEYLVRMYDDTGAVRDRSDARLVIVDEPSIPAGFIAYPNGESIILQDMLYDAERQAFVVSAYRDAPGFDLDDNVVMRYLYNGGWGAPDTVNVPFSGGVALSADGDDLLVGSEVPLPMSSATQSHVDVFASDLSAIRQSLDTEQRGQRITDIAVISDNRALLLGDDRTSSAGTEVDLYDLDENTIVEFVGRIDEFPSFATVAVSADKQRVVFAGNGNDADYDVAADALTRLNVPVAGARLDRHGDLVVTRRIENLGFVVNYYFEVYDRDWNLLGDVMSVETPAFTLSNDGTRLYTYEQGGILHTYDLTATPVAGRYPEIGSGTVLAGDPGNLLMMRMVITDDDSTVFVISSDGIAVQPVN